MAGNGGRARIREEAAAWVACVDRGPTEDERKAFSAWLDSDPAHRPAYDQAIARYERSGLLRQSSLREGVSLESEFPRPRQRVARYAMAAGIAGLLVLGTFQVTGGLLGPPIQAVLLSSGPIPRDFLLDDGSSLTLAPASEMQVDLGRKERRAELRRGHARLAVSAEERAFVLVAGSRRVEVSNGDYELDLRTGEGSIEPVQAVAGISSAPVPGDPDASAVSPKQATTARRLEFSSASLRDVVEIANRDSGGPSIVVDPRIADLRVTGLFRAGDSAALARSLAATLNLQLVVGQGGALTLEPRAK
ncbi:FecR/PupR family sigma factor regulator [Sphingomonas sabuli]|uniref:FecR/PupR family sigma factor regulator n=1 Tax=Sphingomonas sabuli TaxID=2764186 RepID=UPI001FEBB882|nr:DUF4880 domain-containing protein [Sphingomonas sabuli]